MCVNQEEMKFQMRCPQTNSELQVRKFPKSSNNKCDRLFTYTLQSHGVHAHEVRRFFLSAILSNIFQSAASKRPRRDESSELPTPSDKSPRFPDKQIFRNIETQTQILGVAFQIQAKYDV
jgi:tRNA(Glu) U13 pseudouridine synthase TruD